MPVKRAVTAKAFRDFIEDDDNLWESDPDTFYDMIDALTAHKAKLVKASSIAEIDELLEQAAVLVEILVAGGHTRSAKAKASPAKASPAKATTTATRKLKTVPLNNSNDELLAILSSPLVPLAKPKPKASAMAPVIPAKSVAKPIAAAKPKPKTRKRSPSESPEVLAAYNIVVPFVPPVISPASCSKLRPEFAEQWIAGLASSLAVEIARHRRDPPRTTRKEVIHAAFDRDFEIKLTEGDGTCLIHAFLTDVSPTYRSLPRTVQRMAGQAFRKQVYAFLHPADAEMKLEREDYDGFAVRTPSTHARIVDVDGNRELRANARAYIRDTDGYLYDTDVAHLQECLGIRILLITKSAVKYDRIRLIGDVSPADLLKEYETERSANIPADKYTKYIMIFVRPGHYEGVKRNGSEQYIFGYPEVRDVIQAAVGQTTMLNNDLKLLFKRNALVKLVNGKTVLATGTLKWWPLSVPPYEPTILRDIMVVDAKGVEHMVGITEVVSVNDAPFDPTPYVIQRFKAGVQVTTTDGQRVTVGSKELLLNKEGKPLGVWLKAPGSSSEVYTFDTIAKVDGGLFTPGRFRTTDSKVEAALENINSANSNSSSNSGSSGSNSSSNSGSSGSNSGTSGSNSGTSGSKTSKASSKASKTSKKSKASNASSGPLRTKHTPAVPTRRLIRKVVP